MEPRHKGSLGCENCRTRRIKCNRLSPRCSQCARAGLRCSGYRTQLDLLFQDQTATIARKFRVRKGNQAQNTPPTVPLLFSPSMPMDQIAWKYYHDNFNVYGRSYAYDERPYLDHSSLASISFTSVGLAALAIIQGDPHLMSLARRRYSSALVLLARDILDPKRTVNEPTVASCFTLSMFEMMACDAPSGAYLWLTHIHGATALLRSLCLATGGACSKIDGLLKFCYTAVLACLISEETVPEVLFQVVQCCRTSEPTTGLLSAIELFTMLVDLVNLYIQTQQMKSQKLVDLIARAATIDQRLVYWNSRLPPMGSNHPASGSAIYSLDQDWLMWARNYQRLCRVLANKVILDNLDAILLSRQTKYSMTHLSKLNLQYAESTFVLSQIPHEIYNSIPFMIGSYENGLPYFTLSSGAFFMITMLQSLIKLTDQRTVKDNWSTSACEWFGSRFDDTKDLVTRHLC
ncbi:hypothetical protein F5883DRAFT_504586 [Diaporthe sp. PMI_573]|nr:hypothetical protein F5883DRAFT_504586 [Diaporthaceae sp. PMI_573]